MSIDRNSWKTSTETGIMPGKSYIRSRKTNWKMHQSWQWGKLGVLPANTSLCINRSCSARKWRVSETTITQLCRISEKIIELKNQHLIKKHKDTTHINYPAEKCGTANTQMPEKIQHYKDNVKRNHFFHSTLHFNLGLDWSTPIGHMIK